MRGASALLGLVALLVAGCGPRSPTPAPSLKPEAVPMAKPATQAGADAVPRGVVPYATYAETKAELEKAKDEHADLLRKYNQALQKRTGKDQGGGGDTSAMQVEVGYALCVYKTGDSCAPAAKVGDKVLLITGWTPTEAHALCGGARNAMVEGRVQGDKLVATKVTFAP